MRGGRVGGRRCQREADVVYYLIIGMYCVRNGHQGDGLRDDDCIAVCVTCQRKVAVRDQSGMDETRPE